MIKSLKRLYSFSMGFWEAFSTHAYFHLFMLFCMLFKYTNLPYNNRMIPFWPMFSRNSICLCFFLRFFLIFVIFSFSLCSSEERRFESTHKYLFNLNNIRNGFCKHIRRCDLKHKQNFSYLLVHTYLIKVHIVITFT